MNSEEDRPAAKIGYEKPTAVDLGPVAPVMGSSCAPGDAISRFSSCSLMGMFASGDCTAGESPGGSCVLAGSGASGCATGLQARTCPDGI